MENSQEWLSKVLWHYIKEDFCHCIGTKKRNIMSYSGKIHNSQLLKFAIGIY